MKPDWHWTNKPKSERRKILQKMSVGWGKKPKTGKLIKCSWCGKEKYKKLCHIKRSRFLFCSKNCFNMFKKGKIPSNIQQARKNSPIKPGKENINWKGGMPKPYSNEWNGTLKHKVWIRDKNTCQICDKLGQKRSDLVCHHIDFDKKNCQIENIQLLCRSCHMKIHWQERKK